MTTRFSLAELADMLHTQVDAIRQAIDELAKRGELTAESFEYGERNWRIAPTDVKKIQAWIEAKQRSGEYVPQAPTRRLKAKKVIVVENAEDTQK